MEIYEQLREKAAAAFASGRPHLDEFLLSKDRDGRRCLTIVARPSPPIRLAIQELLARIAASYPGQYYYDGREFHVTVMTIISGTEFWREEIHHLRSYRAIIDNVLDRHRTFRVAFRGVTASPGSLMIQGFPLDDGLSAIRDELRTEFARQGHGEALDVRYKISTAHMTVMRLMRPEADWNRLQQILQEEHSTEFGEMEMKTLQLLWGDWYASAATARVLKEYQLS